MLTAKAAETKPGPAKNFVARADSGPAVTND
jgi:hypothetical protein